MRQLRAKREQEYFEHVNYVAERDLKPTHGAYGSNMGMGVQGYIIKGCRGVVYLKDEDVEKAKERMGISSNEQE